MIAPNELQQCVTRDGYAATVAPNGQFLCCGEPVDSPKTHVKEQGRFRARVEKFELETIQPAYSGRDGAVQSRCIQLRHIRFRNQAFRVKKAICRQHRCSAESQKRHIHPFCLTGHPIRNADLSAPTQLKSYIDDGRFR
jgi:hypothetical protein